MAETDHLQTYLETIWHRADADADAARLALLLELLAALPDPAVREFVVARGEAIGRRCGIGGYDEWRAERG